MVDPERDPRRPAGRSPARRRELLGAVPVQAARRQPALPAHAVRGPGHRDAGLEDLHPAGARLAARPRLQPPLPAGRRHRRARPAPSPTASSGTASSGFGSSATSRSRRHAGGADHPRWSVRGRCSARSTTSRTSSTAASSTRSPSACRPSTSRCVEPITRLCEEEGKIVRIPVGELGLTLPGGRVEEFDGIPVLSLVYGPDRVLALVAKRLLDVVLGAAALIILAPILALIGLVVRLIDGGPVLFRQTRVGLHGRPFQVVKFRTMVPDAEDRLDELQERNEIQRPRVQGHRRPPPDPDRPRPAGDEPRRAAPDLERAARRDEPRRAAPAPAARGRRATTCGTAAGCR